LSREHVEYVKVAWAENVDFGGFNFRVLRGIFWGVSIKQKLLKIEKYQGRWPFFLDLSIFRVKKCKKTNFAQKLKSHNLHYVLIFVVSLRVLREVLKGVCFYANLL